MTAALYEDVRGRRRRASAPTYPIPPDQLKAELVPVRAALDRYAAAHPPPPKWPELAVLLFLLTVLAVAACL